MSESEGIVEMMKGSILELWKEGAIEVFDEHIKPEGDFAKEIAAAVALVTYELATAPDDETAAQKRESLQSAKRILKRKAEGLGAVVRNEVWERSMATIETVGTVFAKFAKGAISGLI